MGNDGPLTDKRLDEFCEKCIGIDEDACLVKYPKMKRFVRDLKISLVESSIRNRNFLMVFSLLQVYTLVTVSGVTDLNLLLPNINISLPVVGFSVPLKGFFLLAPLFLFLCHFNLLFNFSQHCRKLYAWEVINGCKNDDLLLPGFMLNSVTRFGKTKGINTFLVKGSLFIALYFFPVVLLFFIQYRFSRYQDIGITLWNMIIMMLDIFLLTIYWEKIIHETIFDDEENSFAETWEKHYGNNGVLVIMWKLSIVLVSSLPLALFIFIAHGGYIAKGHLFYNTLIAIIYIYSITNIIIFFVNWNSIKSRGYLKNIKEHMLTVYFIRPLWEKRGHFLFFPRLFYVSFLLLPLTELYSENLFFMVFGSYLLLVGPIRETVYAIGANHKHLSFLGGQILFFKNFHKSSYKILILGITIYGMSELDKYHSVPELWMVAYFFLLMISYFISFFESYQEGNRVIHFLKANVMFILLVPIISRLYKTLKAFFHIRLLTQFSTFMIFFGFLNGFMVLLINSYVIDDTSLKTMGNQSQGAFVEKEGKSHQAQDTLSLEGVSIGIKEKLLILYKHSIPHIVVKDEYVSQASILVGLLKLESIGSIEDLPSKKFFKKLDFRDRNLNLINLSGSTLKNANFKGCNMYYATLNHTGLKEATLEGADLTGATLEGADLTKTNFKGANLTKANLSGAAFLHTDFSGANLKAANFKKTDITTINFKGALYLDTIMVDTDQQETLSKWIKKG